MGLDLGIYKIAKEGKTDVASNLDAGDLVALSDEEFAPIERDASLDCALHAVEVDIEQLVKKGIKKLHVVVWE